MNNATRDGFLGIQKPADGSGKRLGVLLTLALVLLYLASVGWRWHIGSDSALYLLLGESLADGNGYTLWGRPHIFVPPLYPICLATMMRLGLGDMFWLNLGMIVLALTGLWFAYSLIREHSSTGWALVVTCVVGFSSQMHELSMSQLSDVPFMGLVCGGLWCYRRGLRGGRLFLELGTVALVASCWVRVVGIPLAIAAAIGLLLQSREISTRRVWANALSLVLAAAVTTTIFIVWHHTHQGPLPGASYAIQIEALSHRSWWSWLVQPFSNICQTGNQYSVLLAGQELPAIVATIVFTIPTLIGLWCFARRREWIGVLATTGYLGAILILRPMLARYLLPVAPLLVLYYLEGLQYLIQWNLRFRSHSARIAIICTAALVIINFPKDVRRVYAVHHPRFYEVANRSWPGLLEAAAFLRQTANAGEMFLSDHDYRQLAYLSRVPFLELSKAWRNQRMSVGQLQPILEQHRVRLLVFKNGSVEVPLFQTLRQIADNPSEYVEVFHNSEFRVFRRIDQNSTASARPISFRTPHQ